METGKTLGNLIGKRFGQLTVISLEKLAGSKRQYARCRCECGKEPWCAVRDLRSGAIQHCGCNRYKKPAKKPSRVKKPVKIKEFRRAAAKEHRAARQARKERRWTARTRTAARRARQAEEAERKAQRTAQKEQIAQAAEKRLKRYGGLGGTKGCGEWLSFNEFSQDSRKKAPFGLDTYCKACSARKEKDRPKPKRTDGRAKALKKKYNLTLAQHDAILNSQGRACGRCRVPFVEPFTPVTGPQTDHCHDHCDACRQTGKTCGSPDAIRGLLCMACSVLLTTSFCLSHPDDPYLVRYRARRAAAELEAA